MLEPNYSIINDPDDPQYIEERNNRKLTADKIRQILSKVLNDPSTSARRWVWELIQNAKDVPGTVFDSVSVQIILTENKLEFRHNGDPFTLSNIFSLIQQVSSKDSVNTDEEVTGKFGTGFIATHLLSEIIDVKGIVFHKGVYRKFEISLDRSGRTSEELLPKIETALNQIRDIQNESLFPSVSNYPDHRTEASFDTTFTYYLSSDEKRNSALQGIEDLIHTLPLTLVNLGKIKRVEVINSLNGFNDEYTISEEGKKGKLCYYKVHIRKGQVEQAKFFAKLTSDNTALSVELSSLDTKELISISRKTPYLFRDFPLIGSEKFFFPFILNGFKFNPKDDRDGVLLHSMESPEAQENRQYIEEAFALAQELVTELINENAKNRYVFANSRLPDEHWEILSKEWYEELQKRYKQSLLDIAIVETEAGDIANLRECLIPSFGASDETKRDFFAVVLDFLGEHRVPARSIILHWISALGPSDELELWGHPINYNLNRLIDDLEAIGGLKNLDQIISEETTSIDWLNRVYQFLIKENQIEHLQKADIIPTMNGDFKTMKELHEEDRISVIPDEILDTLDLLGFKWRDEIIHREIKLPGQNVDKRDLVKASHTINDVLKKESKNKHGVYESDFMKKENAFQILVSLLCNVESIDSNDNFRCKVFLKAKELYGFEESFRPVTNLKDFRFEQALKHFIRSVHDRIQSAGTIDALSSMLKTDYDGAVLWLNDYLLLIQEKEDYKTNLEYGNIFPNRKGELIALDSIYGFGTEDHPLDDDLIRILKELDGNEDWLDFLIHDGVEIKLTPKKFEELGSTIDQTIRELEKEESQTPGTLDSFKQVIYDLIGWCNRNQNQELAIKYLSHTVKRSNDLWVKFSMTPEIMSILRDEKSMKLLTELSKANLSESDKSKVIELANTIGELSEKGKAKLMLQAAELIEDERDFEFKRQVGKRVEDALKSLFEGKFPDYEVRYVGKGAYDFQILNTNNDKKYFIELKSIKFSNLDLIKMAISQAKFAQENPDNYALLVIQRPQNQSGLTDQYLVDNIKCVYQIGNNVKSPVDNSVQIESIMRSQGVIKLSIEDPTMKVFIPQEYVDKLGKTFDSLLDKINEAVR